MPTAKEKGLPFLRNDMDNVVIQLNEMEALLTPKKGWVRNVSGYEYVFDFHCAHYPVIIKVLSTVSTNPNHPPNKGSHEIRVFSVKKSGMAPTAHIVSGLTKSIRLNLKPGWQDKVKCAVMLTIEQVKKIYRHQQVSSR